MKIEWKKRENIDNLEYFTKNQAQGSNGRAFSIHKQVKTSTGSSTSISFQSSAELCITSNSYQIPNHTMSSNVIFMLQMKRWKHLGFRMS